jgi:hypothetical protein
LRHGMRTQHGKDGRAAGRGRYGACLGRL